MPVLGPGELKIGATGTEIDVSCLVNGARIKADKSQGDATTKLCGTKVPGSVTYDAKLAGNLDVDTDAGAAGLFALSWSAPGTEQDFTFVPNDVDGTSAAGTLVLDPLDLGADKYGDTMTSDFEFAVVGTVTFTYGTGVVVTMETGRPISRPRRALVKAAPAEAAEAAPSKAGKSK